MANGSVSSIIKALFNIGLAPQLRMSAINWLGPSTYAPVVAGIPPALASVGDQITAAAFGLKTIEVLIGGITFDGVYEVIPTRLNATTWILYWRVLATGAQAAAITLNTSTVRLAAFGL